MEKINRIKLIGIIPILFFIGLYITLRKSLPEIQLISEFGIIIILILFFYQISNYLKNKKIFYYYLIFSIGLILIEIIFNFIIKDLEIISMVIKLLPFGFLIASCSLIDKEIGKYYFLTISSILAAFGGIENLGGLLLGISIIFLKNQDEK